MRWRVEKVLGEGLRAFEARGAARRTEAAPIGRGEAIDDAGDQRTLGSDDGEVDILARRQIASRASISSAAMSTLLTLGSSAVPALPGAT